MTPFEHKIDDYNFGTLIRADCREDYTEQNSIFGERACNDLRAFMASANIVFDQATGRNSTPLRLLAIAVASTMLLGNRRSHEWSMPAAGDAVPFAFDLHLNNGLPFSVHSISF